MVGLIDSQVRIPQKRNKIPPLSQYSAADWKDLFHGTHLDSNTDVINNINVGRACASSRVMCFQHI